MVVDHDQIFQNGFLISYFQIFVLIVSVSQRTKNKIVDIGDLPSGSGNESLKKSKGSLGFNGKQFGAADFMIKLNIGNCIGVTFFSQMTILLKIIADRNNASQIIWTMIDDPEKLKKIFRINKVTKSRGPESQDMKSKLC